MTPKTHNELLPPTQSRDNPPISGYTYVFFLSACQVCFTPRATKTWFTTPRSWEHLVGSLPGQHRQTREFTRFPGVRISQFWQAWDRFFSSAGTGQNSLLPIRCQTATQDWISASKGPDMSSGSEPAVWRKAAGTLLESKPRLDKLLSAKATW